MARELVGYAYLVESLGLRARPPSTIAVIDSSVRGTRTVNGHPEVTQYQTTYRPAPTLLGNLQFALRYEGVNLEVLALLFKKTGRADIEKIIAEQPGSIFARRIGYLYEWLTGEEIEAVVAPRAAYVPVVDDSLQFSLLMARGMESSG